MERPLSVIVAGGGTAGHIEPVPAVADALRRRDPAIRITALGAQRGPETTHGNSERELNAWPVAAAGGGRIVADAELTPKYVIDEVIPLLRDSDRLAVMGRAAADAGHCDAADEVARVGLEVAGRD